MRLQRTVILAVLGIQAACSGSGSGGYGGGSGDDATDEDTSTGSSDSGSPPTTDGTAAGDASSRADASTCPPPQSVWTCPIATDAACVVTGAPGSGCAATALPEGQPCGVLPQCSLRVFSCASGLEAGLGNGSVDGYVCTCVGGRWSCDDCFPNDSPCTSEGPSTDAGTGPVSDAGRDDAGFVTVLALARTNACLGRALPTAPSGESTCTVIIAGLPESCAAAGLSPATAQEIDAITASTPTTGGRSPGAVCELGQAAASTNGPGCGGDQQTQSWCYAQRSCLGDAGPPCAEAICTTAAFQAEFIPAAPPDAGFQFFDWEAYLLCP